MALLAITPLMSIPSALYTCQLSYHGATAAGGAMGVDERASAASIDYTAQPCCWGRSELSCACAAVVFVGGGTGGPDPTYHFEFLHQGSGERIGPVAASTGVVTQRFERWGGYRAIVRCSSNAGNSSLASAFDATAHVDFHIAGPGRNYILLSLVLCTYWALLLPPQLRPSAIALCTS